MTIISSIINVLFEEKKITGMYYERLSGHRVTEEKRRRGRAKKGNGILDFELEIKSQRQKSSKIV